MIRWLCVGRNIVFGGLLTKSAMGDATAGGCFSNAVPRPLLISGIEAPNVPLFSLNPVPKTSRQISPNPHAILSELGSSH